MSKLSDFRAVRGAAHSFENLSSKEVNSIRDLQINATKAFSSSGTYTVPHDGWLYLTVIGGGGGANGSDTSDKTDAGDTIVTLPNGEEIVARGGKGGKRHGMMNGEVILPQSLSRYEKTHCISGIPHEDHPDNLNLLRGYPWIVPLFSNNFLFSFNPAESGVTSYPQQGLYGGGGAGTSTERGGYGGSWGSIRSNMNHGAGGGVAHMLPLRVKKDEVIQVTIGAHGRSGNTSQAHLTKMHGGTGYVYMRFIWD